MSFSYAFSGFRCSIRYFYETFPEVTTPMKGIKNERFYNWMRTAAVPKFRKLYAIIKDDVMKDEIITFNVNVNFDVSKYGGAKSLVLTTTSWFGGKNDFLGICFIVVGSMHLAFGLAFIIKQMASPRALGDTRFLDTVTRKENQKSPLPARDEEERNVQK